MATVPDGRDTAAAIRAEQEFLAAAKLRGIRRWCDRYGADEARILTTLEWVGLHRAAADMADQLAALAERYGRPT